MRNFIRKGGLWVAGQGVFFLAIPWTLTIRSELPVWLRVIGGALGIGGLAMLAGGMQALGRHATPFPEPTRDGALVIRGVYAVVRHPIYGGLGLTSLGLGLAWPSLPAVALGLLLLVFFRFKAASEEQRLLAVYPNYARYRRDVRSMLVPFIL